jgi:phosphoglycerol transferase MdoB-like AlkP superfamily enzyme
MIDIVSVLSLMFVILPPGTVKDERTFFILLSLLITFIIIALVLRHRRIKVGI